MAYEGSVELISGIKQANNGTFPLVDASAVRVTDNKRLTDALTDIGSDKADKTDTILETTMSRGRKATTTVGTGSFAFGSNVEASGNYSHAEGNQTVANHYSQHVFGEFNNADDSSEAVSSRGNFVEIVGNGSSENARSNARALDWNGNEYLNGDLYINCDDDSDNGTSIIGALATKANAVNPVFTGSISMGRRENTTIGDRSVTFGNYGEASGEYSLAEGFACEASGDCSHAEGYNSTATGENAHAENQAEARGVNSHAEGDASAQGDYSHAEGKSDALGNFQHTFGVFNKYDNPLTDWAPNTQYTKDDYCAYHHFESGQHHYYVLQCTGDFTSGSTIGTITDHWDIIGHTTNAKINSLYVEVVGNGRNGTYPSNARALDWQGNEYLKGDLYINCNNDSTNGKKVVPIPSVTSSDDGSILCVVDGEWTMLPGAFIKMEKTISAEMLPTSLDPGESKSLNFLSTDIPDCMIKSTVAVKTASFSDLPSSVVGEVTSIGYSASYGINYQVKLTNESESAYVNVSSDAAVSLTYSYYSF